MRNFVVVAALLACVCTAAAIIPGGGSNVLGVSSSAPTAASSAVAPSSPQQKEVEGFISLLPNLENNAQPGNVDQWTPQSQLGSFTEGQQVTCKAAADFAVHFINTHGRGGAVVLNSVVHCKEHTINTTTVYLLILALNSNNSNADEAFIVEKKGTVLSTPYENPEKLDEYLHKIVPHLDIKDSSGHIEYHKKYVELVDTLKTRYPQQYQVAVVDQGGFGGGERPFGYAFREQFQRKSALRDNIPSLAATPEVCLFYIRKIKEGKLKIWGPAIRSIAYGINTFCACLNTHGTGSEKVRGYLQWDINRQNAQGKTVFTTDDVYYSHVRAYRHAGCGCGPADKWAWYGVTNVPLNNPSLDQFSANPTGMCKLVEWSIRIAGSCNGCYIGFGCPFGSFCKKICTPCLSF